MQPKSIRCLYAVLMGAASFLGAEVGAAPSDAQTAHKLADGSGYVSLVRLKTQTPVSQNGVVLTVFEGPGMGGIPLYESRDDGTSWTLVTHVTDQVHTNSRQCQLRWQPNLIELPRDSGPLKAGTLLLSANASCNDERGWVVGENLQVYASTDLGRTWHYRGTIISGQGHPEDKDNHGVWESNVQILDDGRMVAYYSTEQHKDKGYNQLLAHKVSSDGGKTWGSEVYDVAVGGGVERPGMAVVTRLPDGRYVMSYEDIDGPHSGQVFVKFSRDGLDWGGPSFNGIPVQTAGGAWPEACPVVQWFPLDGPQGIVVISAERAGGDGDAGGHTLYWNNDLGRGPWWEVRAPVQKETGNIHAGWTQALMLRPDGQILHLTSSSVAAHPEDGADNEILYAAAQLDFHRYEAEDAARTGGVVMIGDRKASNLGRVRIPIGEKARIAFDIHVAEGGTYPVTVRFAESELPGQPQISINGARQPQPAAAPENDGWFTLTVRTALTAGTNRIELSGGAQAVDVDYIELGTPAK